MFWQDDEKPPEYKVADNVIDLVFSIDCRELPVDHAHTLGEALFNALPLIKEDDRIAIHSIHLAGSQNGWERPDASLGQKLVLSRRTKLTLRVPKEHRETIEQELNGITLDIDGHKLTIGKAKTKALSSQTTIFARHIVLLPGEDDDENAFLMRIVKDLQSRNIRVKKALCGMTASIQTHTGPILTRSIMLAELHVDESVQLQEQGLGSHRELGCGIFIPHKGIEAVNKPQGE